MMEGIEENNFKTEKMLGKPGNFVANCLLQFIQNHCVRVLSSSETEQLSRKRFDIHHTGAGSERSLHQKVPGFVSLTPEDILQSRQVKV